MANEKRLIDPEDFLDLFYVASAGQDKAFVKTVEMVVEDTPTVDAVEMVHGKWTIIVDDYDCEFMCCSVCGEMFYDGDNDTVDCLHNYCPNCGAKMDGGNEDV